MHIDRLLHNTFENNLISHNKARLKGLMAVCSVAMKSNKLYLTGIGRDLQNTNKERSNIQKIDRLLKNPHLGRELIQMYVVMTSHFVKENSTPLIHVDWSCINPVTNLYVLRASLSMKGRALVLYEACHPKKKENNHAVHKEFLNQLKRMLPKSAKPIIVTDAGFRGPWFEHVMSLNWDFVGRVRNKNLIHLDGTEDWVLSSTYFDEATGTPTYKGSGLLTKANKTPVNVVLYKGESKCRHRLTTKKQISKGGTSKKHAKGQKEPWVLVTSLQHTSDLAKKAVNTYKQRMRIEENLRDTKCPHYGLGLKKSLTRSTARMGVLLLIAAIATFAAWLAGIFTWWNGKAADYQAHSSKFKSVLSIVFLGRRVLIKGMSIKKNEFDHAIELLYQISLETQKEALA